MVKGSVCPHRWTYNGKKRKAWGIRYRTDGGPLIRKIAASSKDAAEADLDRVREQYRFSPSRSSAGGRWRRSGPVSTT